MSTRPPIVRRARAATWAIRCAAFGAIACGVATVAPAAGKAPAAEKAPAVPKAPAAKRLSAEQIVEKSVAARGGLEAWRKIQTMAWFGHIESAHAPVPVVQFVFEQERPNKSHFEINAMGDRTMRVFDGKQGWKLRPAHGRPEVNPYTLEEIRFEQSGPGIDGVLVDYAAKGTSVEVAGIDEVEKQRAYHLIVRTASGETQNLWVDAKTFLEVRYDRSVLGKEGAPRTISVVYRDYRTVEDVKIPFIVETGVGTGTSPDRMVIERVALNPRLEARAFLQPGASRRSMVMPTPDRGSAPPQGTSHRSPPSWLQPGNPPGSPAPSPSAAPAAPAEGSPAQPDAASPAPSPQTDPPRQPGSSSTPGQDRG